MNIPRGGPAFPVPTFKDADKTVVLAEHEGMSLRQWYAGMAIQGLLAKGGVANREPVHYVMDAFKVADAMIQHEKDDK